MFPKLSENIFSLFQSIVNSIRVSDNSGISTASSSNKDTVSQISGEVSFTLTKKTSNVPSTIQSPIQKALPSQKLQPHLNHAYHPQEARIPRRTLAENGKKRKKRRPPRPRYFLILPVCPPSTRAAANQCRGTFSPARRTTSPAAAAGTYLIYVTREKEPGVPLGRSCPSRLLQSCASLDFPRGARSRAPGPGLKVNIKPVLNFRRVSIFGWCWDVEFRGEVGGCGWSWHWDWRLWVNTAEEGFGMRGCAWC